MTTRASYTRCWRLLAAAGVLLAGAAHAVDATAVRAEFRAALQRVDSGSASEPADSDALRAYVLYPYLAAARLQRALSTHADEALDGAAIDLLRANPDLPVMRTLRHDWLLSLAARQRWGELLANLDDAETDPALVCARFQAWIATGPPPELRDEVFKLWLSGEARPQSCVPPFEWLRAQGALTPEAHLQRARRALAAGNTELAEWLLRAVPPEQAPPLQSQLRLLQAPARELPALLADRARPIDADVLLQVWVRYARGQPQAAQPLLPRLAASRRLDAQQLDVARSALAQGLAWNRDPGAVPLFLEVPDAALDDAGHEWRVRAALWAGDWDRAAEWLHRMPPALAADPRWTYWRARSLEAHGSKQPEAVYRTLAKNNGYIGMLAAWRLHQKVSPSTTRLPSDGALQERLAQAPALQRAHELFLVDRLDWASAEWRAALHDAEPAARIQAARLAASWGWYAIAVPTLAGLQLPDDLELLYPDAYGEVIAQAARQTGVPAPVLYGVMRQESLFLPGAVSSSQAIGLLQLLLPTARHVALREKWPAPTREELMEPARNAALGAVYLRDLLTRFGGRLAPALAGYNAGPNAAARWIPQQPMDVDVWIENIPFNQTRLYVGKILWHVLVRQWRLSGAAQDPAPLLQSVGPQPLAVAQER